MLPPRPARRPGNPSFSSGPCPKRPGWSPAALDGALVGRSHRSLVGQARLREAIDRTRALLEVPATHRIAIVPASDTGAVEMAMWSLLGARPVTVLAWETFGKEWLTDALEQLKLPVRALVSEYGALPDLAGIDFAHDVVFAWNGTAAGVRVPDGAFIPAHRQGLTICDATSAAFAVTLPWNKLDVATFSWQKVMGGEAAHGMLILGPRAVTRLEEVPPPWPVPKIFRLVRAGRLDERLFGGWTVNTPSMLCVEDYLDALRWGARIGGLAALHGRVAANAAALQAWVGRTPWIANLAVDPATRSTTSVTLRVVDPRIAARPEAAQAAFARSLVDLLEAEGAAFDIGAYRDAPPGLRVWCGATVETTDVVALTDWLDWGFAALAAHEARGT